MGLRERETNHFNKLVLAPFAVSISLLACANDNSSRAVAERTVQAMLNNDPRNFEELVAPDKRVRIGQGAGLALGPTDVEAIKDCRGAKVEYFERQVNQLGVSSIVTVKFERNCITYFGAKRDTMLVFIEEVNGRKYISSIS